MSRSYIADRLRNVSVSGTVLRVVSASLMPLVALGSLVGLEATGLLDRFISASAGEQKSVLLVTGICVVVFWLFRNFADRFGGVDEVDIECAQSVQHTYCGCGETPDTHRTPDEYDSLRDELGFEAVEIAIVRSPRGSAPHVVEQLARQLRSTQSTAPADVRQIARHESAHAVVAWALGGTVYEIVVDAETDSGYVMSVFPLDTLPHERLWLDMVTFLAGNVVDQSHGVRRDGAWSDFNNVLTFATQLLSIGLLPSGFEGSLTTDALVVAARQRAEEILASHAELVEVLAEALVVQNRMDGHEVREVLEGSSGYDDTVALSST